MNSKTFAGVGVALVTPFQQNMQIDFHGLKNLLDHTYASGEGVDYWVVMGTTAESATLNKEEKKEVLNFIKSNNPNQLPIVYGIGGNNTQAVIDELKSIDPDGLSAILSVSPYYNKPSQKGIMAHYTSIADHSPLPIIMYNVPGRTSSNMTAETTLHLAKHPNIIALKEATNHVDQWINIMHHKPENFLLLSGDDTATLSMMALGGEGVISVMANGFPEAFRGMVHGALKGDFKQAAQFLFQLSEVNPLMYEESNPVGIKEVLRIQGVCGNQVRLPLVAASTDLQEKIQRQVKLPDSMGIS